MHLIIVNREDLSYFAHIHPKLDKQTGIFHITHTFAEAGKYKMWIDVKPKDGIQILTAFAFNVEGQPVHSPATIAHEQTHVKNVVTDRQSEISLVGIRQFTKAQQRQENNDEQYITNNDRLPFPPNISELFVIQLKT